MIYFLTVKEILILSMNIYLFTKSIIIRGNYILTRNYIHFKEPYQFVQRNISSFNETYSIREITKAICSFKETIYIYIYHCPCHFCYHRAKKYHPNRFPLPTLYLRQNLMCPLANRLYLKGTIEHSSNCEFLLKIYHFLSFGSRFHR